ncbi:proline iminopeptidase [Pseudomonas sp. IT-P258]|uniref:alpha/beta fold hydrolase n=1 Tax=unclassified Pseudomonas TaxID=196821 RepID=UPI0039E11457
MTGTLQTNGYYPTGDGHQLYWERHGTPGAEPVFFLHGGPGGRCRHEHLEFFDLECFDVVLFDQRGCGRSLPHGELRDNTCGLSVEDIDGLRQHLDFEKISLLGVSWGSWLAIQYQQRYRDTLLKTTLVSVFVPFADNVSAYEQMLNHGLSTLTGCHASHSLRDIFRILCEGCPLQQRHAAIQWLQALLQQTGQSIGRNTLEDFVDDEAIRAIRLELHYHMQQYCFTPANEELTLDRNTLLMQGVRDAFGMASVRWLRQRLNLDCRLLYAGHNAFAPSMLKAVRYALKRVARD